MDRREFLDAIAGISVLIPSLSLLPGSLAQAQELQARAQSSGTLRALTPQQDATVSSIADMLLPQTDTVGAAAVGVNRFIDLLLAEAMLEPDRDRVLAGIDAIDARSQALFGAPFSAAHASDRESLLVALESQLPSHDPSLLQSAALRQAPVTPERAYATLKRLVVYAYFTSEPVAARMLNNDPIIPGRFDGCVNV